MRRSDVKRWLVIEIPVSTVAFQRDAVDNYRQ